MTDAVQVELIRAVPQIATAIGVAFAAWIGYRKLKYIAIETLSQSQQTHTQINSRMDELLRVTRASEFAKGKLEAQSEAAQGDSPNGPKTV